MGQQFLLFAKITGWITTTILIQSCLRRLITSRQIAHLILPPTKLRPRKSSISLRVKAALDILAEFCTQKNQENHTAFTLKFKEQPSDNEVKILKWDNIDLTKQDAIESKCIYIDDPTINVKTKSKAKTKTVLNALEPCGKPAKFIKDNKCYCLKHSKLTNFLQPAADLKPAQTNGTRKTTKAKTASKKQAA